jgi:N-acyl amino acid synthase of PEP-CTERM/exosortase system
MVDPDSDDRRNATEALAMFDDNFRVCFADTPFGVALHQRIRYQVFCLDRGFEDPNAFSTAKETDAWDDRSAHFIVQNKRTGQWVAATRLVLPRKGRTLPIDELGALNRRLLPYDDLPVAEISRFCIIRGRSVLTTETGTELHPNSLEAWGIGPVGKSQQFEVTIGMIRTMVIFTLKRGLTHCVFVVTEAFARLLRKLGLNLTQVGQAIDHRGMRTPYVIDMLETAQLMGRRSSAVRELYRRSRHAYVRISTVLQDDTADCVSEFAPDHSLFNETVFRESVLLPAESDSGLSIETSELGLASVFRERRKAS